MGEIFRDFYRSSIVAQDDLTVVRQIFDGISNDSSRICVSIDL
ncbi:RNA polymerase sigma factor RpoD [Burkholderia pseudomallei 305]|nr:RNA polymerase sigma factor RpoD [Burkholderia pseudomallei 305]